MNGLRVLISLLFFVGSTQGYGFMAESIAIHGFVSQGYLQTQENDYLGKTQEGTFLFHESALNFSSELGDQVWVGVQLFSRRLGDQADKPVMLDWALGDYHFSETCGVRLGKIRQPLGLYNEVWDIDAVRTPIFFPPSIYPESFRQYQSTFLGLSWYGTKDWPCAGVVSYDFFLGTLDASAKDCLFTDGFSGAARALGAVSYTGGEVVPRYIFGGRLFYTPQCWEQLRFGVSVARSVFTVAVDFPSILLPTVQYTSLDTEFRRELLILSAELNLEKWCFAAEWALRPFEIDVKVDFPPTFPMPDVETTIKNYSEAYYFSGEWEGGEAWRLGGYLSVMNVDRSRSAEGSQYTRDLAGTLRYDVNDFFIIKLEAHNMQGSGLVNSWSSNVAGLAESLVGGSSTTHLDHAWWLFALKGTFSF